MPKQRINVRVDEDLWAWVVGYGASRGTPATAVLESALREFREACGGGVPDLEPPAPEPAPPVPPRPSRAVRGRQAVVSPGRVASDAGGAYRRMMAERQERLNRSDR